jgi:hypothetical protein
MIHFRILGSVWLLVGFVSAIKLPIDLWAAPTISPGRLFYEGANLTIHRPNLEGGILIFLAVVRSRFGIPPPVGCADQWRAPHPVFSLSPKMPV